MSEQQPQSNTATTGDNTTTSDAAAVARTPDTTPKTDSTPPTEQPMPVESGPTEPTAATTKRTDQPENGTTASTIVLPASGATAEAAATVPSTAQPQAIVESTTVPQGATTPPAAASPVPGTTVNPSSATNAITTLVQTPVVMAEAVPTSTLTPAEPTIFSNWIYNEGGVITGLDNNNSSLKILVTHLEIFKIIWDTLENIYQRIKKLSPGLASLILFCVCVLTNIANYFGPKLVQLCKSVIMLWVDVVETIVRLTLLPIEKIIDFILTFIRIACGPIFGTFCSHRLTEVLESKGMIMPQRTM